MLKANDLLLRGKLLYSSMLKDYEDILEDEVLYRNYFEDVESLKDIAHVDCTVLEHQNVMEYYDKCAVMLTDIAISGGYLDYVL